MADMTEAELAAYLDAQAAARRAFDRMRCDALRGNPAAADRVNAAWEPVLQFHQEQRRHERPREEKEPCDGAAFD